MKHRVLSYTICFLNAWILFAKLTEFVRGPRVDGTPSIRVTNGDQHKLKEGGRSLGNQIQGREFHLDEKYIRSILTGKPVEADNEFPSRGSMLHSKSYMLLYDASAQTQPHIFAHTEICSIIPANLLGVQINQQKYSNGLLDQAVEKFNQERKTDSK